MTPEARLAAAVSKGLGLTLYDDPNPEEAAADILAADPALAADLELAAAVRRLEETVAAKWGHEEGRGVEWQMGINRWHRPPLDPVYEVHVDHRIFGDGPTLTAAIEEALR